MSKYDSDLLSEYGIPQVAAELLSNCLVGNRHVLHDMGRCEAEFGDVVNIRVPPKYAAHPPAPCTSVPYPLNQLWEFDFILKDGEHSLTVQDIIDIHVSTPMKLMAGYIDRHLYEKIICAPDIVRVSGHTPLINAQLQLDSTKTITKGRHCVLPYEQIPLLSFGDISIHGDKILRAHNMGVAFHNDAIALCTRPTKPKHLERGCHFSVSHNDIIVNCDMSYHVNSAGTLIEISVLGGVCVLEPEMVCVMSFKKGG